jgi:hypothetical protein
MKTSCALVALSFVACATAPAVQREKLGEIQFRSYINATRAPITYSVQTGRVFNPNLDLIVASDGKISGSVGSGMLRLYPNNEKAPAPQSPGNVVQTWSSPSGGNFTVEVTDDGKWLSMLGYAMTTNMVNIRMQARVPIGEGPAWAEMRKNPALLAVAAAIAGVRGEAEDKE